MTRLVTTGVCHISKAPAIDAISAMRFTPTALEGAFIVHLERQVDERGFFARSFCSKEFKAHGLLLNVAQSNIAFSRRKGTLRGLHYQVPPSSEVKLMRCTKGVIYDDPRYAR